MKIKISSTPAKVLKAIHVFAITFWIGGLLTWVPLIFGMPLNDSQATYQTYSNLKAIAWNVIGWGGIGSFITGLLNALFTKWGLFRHKWIILKLALTISMILCGMFFTEQKMLANLMLLKDNKEGILSNQVFLSNHSAIKMVIPLQLLVFFIIILISVLKPWMRSETKSIA